MAASGNEDCLLHQCKKPCIHRKYNLCRYRDEIIADCLMELTKYREIGTVEECREAVEKQIPEKEIVKVADEDIKVGCVLFKTGTKVHYCPDCGISVTGSENYCRRCGKALIY